ncbi:MAG: hypothetical protein ACI399_06995 [Candidatus Cryptobacteroides sp.]
MINVKPLAPIRFLVCIVLASSAICCDKNPVRDRLADIDSYAASNPDSARRALEAIDQDFLNTRRLKAEYALMLSTALSRCNIKVPDDSLINIAVDYFKAFGPKKEKFLSYYYKGRVYHDMEDYESAMLNYLKAECIHSKDIPLKYKTSIQLKKGEIYQHYYDYDKAVESYRKAQTLALQCDWKSNYFYSMFGELTQHIIFNKKDKTDSMIQCILPYQNEMTLRHRMTFAGRIIQASWSSADKDSLLSIAQEYEHNYSSINGFQWDLLSTCYTKAGALSDAERTLEVFKEQIDDPSSNLRYLKAFVELADSLGLQEDSQKAKASFLELLGLQVYNKGISDLRFMEERIAQAKRARKMKWAIALGSLIVVILCIVSFLELKKRRKQKERIGELYDSLKEEYAQMSALLQNNSDIQEEARKVLGKRVQSLAQFLSADPPSSLNRVADQLDSLTENRKDLLETIGLLYAVYHPSFVNRLQEYGLSNGEIGYCCLLILGFRTGEIGDVINRSSSYHISSAIRQKVGLGPKDTNLSIFMKNLYRETENQDS